MKSVRRMIPLVVLLLVGAAQARADITLPRLFGDRMVLQRDARVAVWGKADPMEQVTVTIAGQSKSTNADEQGKWKLWLDPISAPDPLTMTVTGKNTITISDVLMGEVWVCSGQSNMEWPVRMSKDPEAVAAGADWPKIRFFNVSAKKRPSRTPEWDVDADWALCTPETATHFSAVAYHFARHLHQRLGNVPIGLINVSWGGMTAEAFTDRATLEADPEFKDILDAFAADVAKYPEARAEYEKKLAEWQELRKAAEAKGERPPPQPRGPRGPDAPNGPSNLWNGMIHPIVPYGMRGVIWYQGESNAGSIERAIEYRRLMPAMIGGWRKAWGQGDFPFLMVQLANFKAAAAEPAEPKSEWAMIREAQALTVENTPNVGLATIIDIGEANDIHPRNKQDVGKRLGLAAEKLAYGRDVAYSGPVFKSMRVDGGRAILEFDHVEGGFKVDHTASDHQAPAVAIAGSDGVFHRGRVSFEGTSMIVTHPLVSRPAVVRYAWANNPVANIYNGVGLPMVPFRTDRD